jgi:hypothetical protein
MGVKVRGGLGPGAGAGPVPAAGEGMPAAGSGKLIGALVGDEGVLP